MTRDEAIDELSVICERLSHPEDCENGCYSFRDGDYTEALDMAIELLNNTTESSNGVIKSQNDVIEVVRCKDCRFWKNEHLCLVLSRHGSIDTKAEHYCSWGERREE